MSTGILRKRIFDQFTNKNIVEVFYIKKISSNGEWYYNGEQDSYWSSLYWYKYATPFNYPPIQELQEIMERESDPEDNFREIYTIESYFKLKND